MKKHLESGFTLMEIALALMVVGVGLLAIFNLFPAGLRSSINATAYTRSSQFSEELFNAIRAEAYAMTNRADWTAFMAEGNLSTETFDTYANGGGIENATMPSAFTQIEYPKGQGEWLRYRIDSIDNLSDRLVAIRLAVRYGKTGSIEHQFYAEIYNWGM